MDVSELVSVVIVNYKTHDLTRRCFDSLRGHYPSVPVLLVDNGSGDDSAQFIAEQEGPHTTPVLLAQNYGHGPGLDAGLCEAQTPYAFTLDSDSEVRRGGLLEEMVELFLGNDALYAVGEVQWLQHLGRDWRTPDPAYPGQAPYVHPAAMMLDRAKYVGLLPFMRGGCPCRANMLEAFLTGYEVRDFPIGGWVFHLHRGSRERLEKGEVA